MPLYLPYTPNQPPLSRSLHNLSSKLWLRDSHCHSEGKRIAMTPQRKPPRVLRPAPDRHTSNDIPNLANSGLASFVPCFSQEEIRTILDSAQHPSSIDAFVNTLRAGSMDNNIGPYPCFQGVGRWHYAELVAGAFRASLFCGMVLLIFWES